MESVQYTVTRSQEYDAFGPWIYEIGGEHEVPKLFKNHLNKIENPLLLFKVPRNIERRKASPNMDLYDYLIGAYDTHLHILKRHGSGVKEMKIYYRHINAIKDVHALLKGELIIITNELIVIGYNTVSEDIIRKLINIMMNKISNGSIREHVWESMPAEYEQDNKEKLDMLFFNLFNKLKRSNPACELIAYQPRLYIDGRKMVRADKRVMSQAAFTSDGKQMTILERETPKWKNGKEEYAYSYLYLPIDSITDIRAQAIDDKRQFYNMKITADYHDFNYIFQRDNKRIWDIVKKLEAV